MRIAVDVMGGDHGPRVVIEGAGAALAKEASIQALYLVGRAPEIQASMEAAGVSDPRVQIVHAEEVLAMDEKPILGLRRKKDCSILRAVDLVKTGQAECVISPGNTGGLVAASMIKLRPLECVERVAIATVIPSKQGEFVLIDSGATPECKPLHLAQFAVMGNVYARAILNRAKPRIGILSNGTEGIKGTALTREALQLCQELDLELAGYVEGHDLFEDRVDVVVTDGFTGNIVLKTCESLAKAIAQMLKSELTANPVRKFGAMISRGAFAGLKQRMDPDTYGGAPLLGLNGAVIKAHGSARQYAIENAVRVAVEFVKSRVTASIRTDLEEANMRFRAVEAT